MISFSKSFVRISISVTGTSGTFTSVNYPGNYFDDYEEHFIISVEAGSRILLYFDFYDIEYHVGCIYDYTEGRIYFDLNCNLFIYVIRVFR